MNRRAMKTGLRSFLLRLKSAFLKPVALSDALGADIQQKLAPLDAMSSLVRTVEERSRTLESLVHIVEERSQTLESLVRTVEERSRTLESLVHIVEERSQTLEYLARQSIFAENHQIEKLHQFYVESMPHVLGLDQRAAFNAASILELKTDYPIAVGSNDHINPDSTMEGVTRPTLFVQNCISVLGTEIKCLDLGSGAAGLVYEFAMNQILAIGVDGSDFCRINRIGYWPLLEKNLFTCDITKPFSFLSQGTQNLVKFDVVTMWEVLEHIAESELPSLFWNINRHLNSDGYFIGSISSIEYLDSNGSPYHVTVKPREWWKMKFLESDLIMLDAHPFNEKLFCRGNGPRFQDFHNYALNPDEGFLFVAEKKPGTKIFTKDALGSTASLQT